MDEMIDFTASPINRFKAYGGANGKKINVTYEGKSYMLKFPPKPTVNKRMSYANSCISEYISCRIFETLGLDAQKALLGNYTTTKGKSYLVVACEDFTTNQKKLIEFSELKNTCIDSEQSGYGTELSHILDAIEEQTLISPLELKNFFWDMFVADALLGNFDRHNGNWGILVDEVNQRAEIAPVYDCGSCLYPQLMPADLQKIMNDKNEINRRIFVYPTSAIQDNGKKINYFDYISSHQNPDCTEALIRIANKIEMEKINRIINETPSILPIQKEFYQMIIQERKTRIIDFSLEKINQLEKQSSRMKRTKNQTSERER